MPGPGQRDDDRAGRSAEPPSAELPDPGIVDPDVDLRDPQQRQLTSGAERATVAVIALGGVLGAEARYLIGLAVPAAPAPFPLPTLLINFTGCLLLGAVMVAATELRAGHRLLRPFLGTGVLGGYTTYSAFAVDVVALVRAGHPLVALAYGGLTLAAGAAATWSGITLARRFGSSSRHRGGAPARQDGAR